MDFHFVDVGPSTESTGNNKDLEYHQLYASTKKENNKRASFLVAVLRCRPASCPEVSLESSSKYRTKTIRKGQR